MKCFQAASVDDIERYLTNRFSEEEQQAFEEHYFGCAECFEKLETVRVIQMAARRVQPRAGSAWWMSGALGLAAALAIAVGLWFWWSDAHRLVSAPVARVTPSAPPDKFALLARFDAPRWPQMRLRGGDGAHTGSFRTAISAYHHGDFATAAQRLAPVNAEARFYLGISLILSGNRAAGTAQLQRVIAGGDTPWLEQARFYQAKALIGTGDLAAARPQLQQVVAAGGDLAGNAQKLLDALAQP